MSSTNPISPSSTNPISSSTNTSSNTSATNSSNAVSSALNISPADFLRLITTQMQAQNPLQPSDPTQFLSQLEQMSQVSSMQSMQTSLTSLQNTLQSSQMANGAALIGQTVLAPATSVALDSSGGAINGAVSAPSGAKSVTVTVTDPSGVLVNSFQVAPASAGLTSFTWNGQNTNGAPVAAGQYTITATSSDGATDTKLNPLVAAKVQSVVVDPSTATLDVTTENGTVPLSTVVSLQ
jgi:flagellar basal-body rod modification protein FlgD